MGKIFLFCACALLFAQISNAAEDAKAVLQADPASGLWKKADIGIIKVQKGTALWFGIPESECPAGKFGRAVVGKDGNLVFEKRPDVPLRFLGFNCLTHGIFVKGDLEKTRRRIKEKVEMIRAQGYNAVTYWPETFSRGKGAENVLLEYEDATDYLLAELKKNGIYIQFRLARPNMGQPEYAWETRDDAKFRCIMLEPKMLEIWRKFATRHLTRINPYTGTCLAEDPMVISVNFFGEMNSGYERLMSQVPYLAPLAEREWRKWLADKYGTIEKLNDAWKLPKPLQSFGDVSMKHYMKRKRPVADWFLFISWKHTQFNKFCRKVIADANYKGLVFEGDGSLHMTDSLARAQDSDICALDRYYCHPRGGFGTVGCKVFQTSAIGDAAAYWRSTASVKINNRPMIIMEYNHCHWNKYKHESGLLFPAYAINQAQQRVAYERQATDEMQRQNMAKNAQAKIEDIILTNKIEQLKAQGRMDEAQALVDEREIKRTMAGLQGVSEEDKKKLADMMRQTNGYKVSQQEQRSARSGGTSGGSRGGGDVSSALARKNSMMADGGGSFIGGTGGSSGSNRKRPATVSAKYADLYDQWKAAGGSKSGQSWTAFRDANKGDAEDRKAGRQTASAKKFSANARAEIGEAEATAKSMTPRPPSGVAATAKAAQGNSPTRSNKSQEQQKPQLAANPALNEKLGAMGASTGGGSDDNKAQSLGEIASAVKTMSETLETLKTTVSALAERKAK